MGDTEWYGADENRHECQLPKRIPYHTESGENVVVRALGSEEPEHGDGGLKSARTTTTEPDSV